MCSKEAESIEVGYQKLQKFETHDGDGNPLRIPSTMHDHFIPPLLSSSPLLRALATSAVKPHSKDSAIATVLLLESKTEIHASTMTPAQRLLHEHSFSDTTKIGLESDELKLKFDEGPTMSKLWIVNLGGNESLAKTEVQGDNLKEAQNINKSLSALRDMISALLRIKALNWFGHVDEENAKAISLFENVVDFSDAIEDEVKWVEDLIRRIITGNIFDLGFAQLAEEFSNEGALDHGRMVYFTCSINSLESGAVVA
ncbi:hypothetical protein D8674_034022 [Pyrus ussuriensis x Pyrus communis]|uniref:Kinesin motor domain-containing protein n=1 Tax=Pyrus ussuriensis x Pyrus communis TaxID=2448454 RepID=A0A5N5HQV6_9ROSA|nr:hypothetical protein D8674_034022 [Pyrus ussuriensis x Pyrus communis]